MTDTEQSISQVIYNTSNLEPNGYHDLGNILYDSNTGAELTGNARNLTKYANLIDFNGASSLLKLARATRFQDFSHASMKELLAEIIAYKPKYKTLLAPLPTLAEEYRSTFVNLYDNAWLNGTSFIFSGSKFIDHPEVLLLESVKKKRETRRNYYKIEYSYFPDSDDTPPPGKVGSKNASAIIQRQNAKLQATLKAKAPAIEKTTLDDLDEEEVFGSADGDDDADDEGTDQLNQPAAGASLDKLISAFNEFKTEMRSQVENSKVVGKKAEKEAKKARAEAIEAKDDAKTALRTANNLKDKLIDVLPEEHENEEDRQFELHMKYEQMNKANKKYQSAVHNEKRKGGIEIHVVDKDRFTKLVNEHRIADTDAIEGKMERVRLERVQTIVKKNGKVLVRAYVNSRYNDRPEIVNRIARANYRNCFGVNVMQPVDYDVTRHLAYLRDECVDPFTKLPVILKFDIGRMGFLVIYLNDKDEGKRQNLRIQRGVEVVRDESIVTKWHPACPLEILKLKKKDVTLANLLKLADNRNYFLLDGKTWETPETARKMYDELADKRKAEREARERNNM